MVVAMVVAMAVLVMVVAMDVPLMVAAMVVVMVVAVLFVDHITHLPTPQPAAPRQSAVEMPAEIFQAAVHLQRHDLMPGA